MPDPAADPRILELFEAWRSAERAAVAAELAAGAAERMAGAAEQAAVIAERVAERALRATTIAHDRYVRRLMALEG